MNTEKSRGILRMGVSPGGSSYDGSSRMDIGVLVVLV